MNGTQMTCRGGGGIKIKIRLYSFVLSLVTPITHLDMVGVTNGGGGALMNGRDEIYMVKTNSNSRNKKIDTCSSIACISSNKDRDDTLGIAAATPACSSPTGKNISTYVILWFLINHNDGK